MAHSNYFAGIEAFSNPSDPMSADRKKSLNSLLPDLAPNVLVDNFITRLHCDAGGFLSDREIEAIRSQTDRCKRVEELVALMKGKDNASFDTFCRVLESASYGHWAKRLMSKAGIQCEGVKDSLSLPLDSLNDILRNKKVLFVPVQKKLHSEFVDLAAKFEGYVFGLGPVKFRVFRRHCSGFIQAQRSGPLGPMPDLPHEIGPLLDMLNQEWNFIDIRLLCDLVERSCESQLIEDLILYKKALEEFSQQKLSELEKCVQIIHDSLGDIDDGAILAAILSKDPTLKEIFRIKDFLIGSLHLEKAKFLGFDSGCTVLFFSIARGSGGNPQHLATAVLTNIHILKEFAVCRVLLLGSWAVEVSSATLHLLKSVCISDSEKEQSVRKEDFNDIVEEVRNLKDQVVSLKLQMWQLNQEKLTTDLDRDIALDSSSNYVESKSEKLPAEQKSVLSLFRRILQPKRKKKTSSSPLSPKEEARSDHSEQLLKMAYSMEITSLDSEPYVISGPRPIRRYYSVSGHSIGNRSQDSGSCSLYSRGGSHGYSGEDLRHYFPARRTYHRPPSTKSCN